MISQPMAARQAGKALKADSAIDLKKPKPQTTENNLILSVHSR